MSKTLPEPFAHFSAMKKFAVISGFLGSGKTSTMIALTQYYTKHYGKAAMITNDLGSKGFADHRLALLSGCNASEIAEECICFCHDVLSQRLNACFDDGAELVVSDIPGFGVGAQEHVYHGMKQDYPGQYSFAPFTVLVEPRSVALLKSGQAGDMAHILHAQLLEADLIVLNKCDLLQDSEREEAISFLCTAYPLSRVIAISAARGDGLEALSQALMQEKASMRHPAIDYEDADLQHAMGELSEYYLQYHATVCCNDFDGNAYLLQLAGQIQAEIKNAGGEVPHLKLLAWEPEGDYGKVDLLGIDRPLEIPHKFAHPCVDLAVVLNTTAVCPYLKLDEIITDAVETVSRQFQLEWMVFRKECFGLGEEE